MGKLKHTDDVVKFTCDVSTVLLFDGFCFCIAGMLKPWASSASTCASDDLDKMALLDALAVRAGCLILLLILHARNAQVGAKMSQSGPLLQDASGHTDKDNKINEIHLKMNSLKLAQSF